LRRPFRPLSAFALLALAPKCAVCVLAYAGIGAVLGSRGSVICGATTGSPDWWAPALILGGIALGIIGLLTGRS
jgi:hypothetical protein